jgi:hypothetical protein
MYAVIGRWNTDPSREADQSREVRDVIVPLVAARAGFVGGYWSRDPETGRSHTTTMWETEESAREFKTLVDDSRQLAATFGVTNDFLVVTDVLAEVHR